jgi:hypothetical protein
MARTVKLKGDNRLLAIDLNLRRLLKLCVAHGASKVCAGSGNGIEGSPFTKNIETLFVEEGHPLRDAIRETDLETS